MNEQFPMDPVHKLDDARADNELALDILEKLASAWRRTSIAVASDLKGSQRGRNNFRPTGLVKAKMETQTTLLNSCARDLDDAIKKIKLLG